MVEKIPKIAFTCYLYKDEKGSWLQRDVDRENLELLTDLISKYECDPIQLFPGHKYEAKDFSGWLIAGGPDIPPEVYGEERDVHTRVLEHCLDRFKVESEFFQNCERNMPILGICYGSQLINVLHGGKLCQHIDSHEEHTGNKKCELEIYESTLLKDILGISAFETKCSHHQACEVLGKGLTPNAHDKKHKNIIHGIEGSREGRWLLGTQFHPERVRNCPLNEKIFEVFLSECKKYNKLTNKK